MNEYKGKPILDRDGTTTGIATGSTRSCQLEGCMGIRVMVRWPDGHRTWPCSKGLLETPGGFQIG